MEWRVSRAFGPYVPLREHATVSGSSTPPCGESQQAPVHFIRVSLEPICGNPCPLGQQGEMTPAPPSDARIWRVAGCCPPSAAVGASIKAPHWSWHHRRLFRTRTLEAEVIGGVRPSGRRIRRDRPSALLRLHARPGIAVAGGLLGSVFSSGGDRRPSDLEGALTPGWIIVIASGVALVLLAVLTRESTAPASPRKSGRPGVAHLGTGRRRVLSTGQRMGGPWKRSLREPNDDGPRRRRHRRAGAPVSHPRRRLTTAGCIAARSAQRFQAWRSLAARRSVQLAADR